jgi:hypothetical protein
VKLPESQLLSNYGYLEIESKIFRILDAATGDGVKALSRSHFSRAARTCSGSTISGFELKWATTDEGYLPA